MRNENLLTGACISEARQTFRGFRFLVYRGQEKTLSAIEKQVVGSTGGARVNIVVTTYETR